MLIDFIAQISLAGLSEPSRELRFHPTRRWRFDYAWPALRLAVEIEGGLHVRGGGRHNRAEGFQRDVHKYNTAVLLGWRLLRVTYPMIRDGSALALIEEALRTFSPKKRNAK